MIVDSHFHFSSMIKRGIDTLPEDLIGIEIGTDAGDTEKRLSLLPPSPHIFFSIGSGPWVLDDNDYVSPDNEREKLLADFSLFGADAIGECGFDNHWGYGTPEAQRDLFMMQVDMASELDLPLIIHTREADKEIREAFLSPSFKCRGIMHCFSSDTELARIALDKGLYISFAGNVTYKSNTAIQEAASYVPQDRILYETDAPYLSPIPMRGKPCMPEYTEHTLSFLSEIRKENKDKLKEAVMENLLKVLKRDKTIRKLC